MKSTMKSAFAIIAVALMIMVAVVPMVSVFTESGDAAESQIIDPTMSKKITVSGKVLQNDGSAVAEDTVVKITYGSISYTAETDDSGAYSFVLPEDSIASAKVEVLKADSAVDTDFGSVTLTKLVAGNTYTADLRSGYLTEEVTLVFKDGAETLGNSDIGLGDVTATLNVYLNGNSSSSGTVKTGIDGKAVVSYPATATKVEVSVASVSIAKATSSDAVTFTGKTVVVGEGESAVVKANEYLITATLSTIDVPVTVTGKVGLTGATNTDLGFLNNKTGGSASIVATYKADSIPASGLKAVFTLTTTTNSSQTSVTTEETDVSVTSDVGSSTITVDTGNYAAGTVSMTVSSAHYKAGTLTIKSGNLNVTASVSGTDGKYLTFLPTTWTREIRQAAEYTFGSYTHDTITITDGNLSNIAVALTATGYAVISGTVKTNETSAVDIVGKEITVTGTSKLDVFGSTTTTTGGAFAFLVNESNVFIQPKDAGTVTYDSIGQYAAGTTGITIKMATKDLSVKLADKAGVAITTATVKFVYDGADYESTGVTSTTGTYKIAVRSDVADSAFSLYVSADSASYTYDFNTVKTAVVYTAGKTYNANERVYTITAYDADGEEIDLSTVSLKVALDSIYINGSKAVVYDWISDITSAVGTGADAGKLQFKASPDYMNKTATTTQTKAVVIYKGTITGLFESIYVANADTDGNIVLSAAKDSLTAKLVRNDGVTGIAGATVIFGEKTTYTQADGSFTLYNDEEFDDGDTITFSKADYVFETSYSVVVSEKKVTTFSPQKDAYTISFVDADGKSITLGSDDDVTIGEEGAEVDTTYNVATLSVKWTAETDALAVTLNDDEDNARRSFEDHTLTATELATGLITVTSNQSTYTFNVTDSAGVGLNGASIQFYKYIGDYPLAVGNAISSETVRGVDGVAKALLPLVDEEDLDTVYGYSVSAGTAMGYAFAYGVTKITATSNDVKSLTAPKTVYLQDATGVALTGTPASVTVIADGVSYDGVATIGAGYFKYLETEGVTYKFTVGNIDSTVYSFVAKQAAVDGVIKAKQETITGNVTDAVGNYTGVEATITAHYSNSSITKTGTQGANDVAYKIIADVSEIAYYTVSMTGYSFENSLTPEIKANETKLAITLETANGVVLFDEETSFATVSSVYAMYKTGVYSSAFTVTDRYIIVDTDLVDYFETSVAAGVFAGDYVSTDGAFVSDIAKYTGNVGYSSAGADEDGVSYEIYNGSSLVKKGVGAVAADGDYTVYADLGLGDKVIVTYTTENATYTAVMDNKAVYNDLKKVVVADDLKAKIIGGKEYGSTSSGDSYFTYTLSTDKTKVYLMAIDTYNLPVKATAGDVGVDNLVAKYVFAGWYVNGEKVTKDLTYTVDNVDSNVVMALYEFDGYYEVDKPVSADNGISPTVLVIGIAAVIIALIAVVYAVIQKKE